MLMMTEWNCQLCGRTVPANTAHRCADTQVFSAEAIKALVALVRRSNVRWRHHENGRLTCSCCGALARETYGEGGPAIVRDGRGCSDSCPWRIAEEALIEYGYKF